MNPYQSGVLTIVLIGVSACSFGPLHSLDPLCSEIAKFANAAEDDLPHRVALATDWGGVFSKESVLYEKNCTHDDYPPGKALCAYLLEHSSTEFAHHNVEDALSCLDSSARRRGESALQSELGNFGVDSRRAVGVSPGLVVSVGFNDGAMKRAPVLKIAARREKAP